MKEKVVSALSVTGLKKEEIESLIEVPPSAELGDFAFPCFILAKTHKKNPIHIALELAAKINHSQFEKVQATGPYINFFVKKEALAKSILEDVLKKKDKYGSSTEGKGKTIVIDLSAPNIAKPFGIGHLRSTIIGSSISKIAQFSSYKTVKINYLGDWGTQFGKLIVGYKKFGDEKKLKRDPINHLLDIYIKVNKDEGLEDEARLEFKKLEDGDKKNLALWKKFRELSLKDFERIYKVLGVSFDVISGESLYNKKMGEVISLLEKKNLIQESDGAKIVDLSAHGLGVCLIAKKDGTTLYATRDLAAVIDRYNKYKFDKMVYEVGAEQSLHFRQLFKILELLGYKWAKDCVHVSHGLYLDSDGKKFATRKGKTVFMSDILEETNELATSELKKREKLAKNELEKRASAIALSAILYGDLKNDRTNNIVFDLERFLSFEGDTGPYLLYTFARAKSILKKAKYKPSSKIVHGEITESEKKLLSKLAEFPGIVSHALRDYSPNIIANYSFQLSQTFNEFYASNQVIGSEYEKFRLQLVDAFSLVLKNSLTLLGINVLERM